MIKGLNIVLVVPSHYALKEGVSFLDSVILLYYTGMSVFRL